MDSATAASVVGPALGLKAHYIAQPESSGTIMPSVVVTAPDNPETGSVTYGVTVTGDGTDGTPSGDFTISDGVNACSGTLDGSGTGSCSLTEYAAYGLYTLTASYDGDSVYTSAESDPLDVTLATATPSVLLTGQDEGSGVVDYSVTVNGPGGAVVPTGTVTISDADGDTCTTDTLEGGSGGCSITFGSSGPFAVSAQYGGDGNYAPATGWPTPNVSVSDNSATTYYGGNLVFIVTVAGPGPAVTPTGSVSWALTGPGDPSCSDSGLVDGTASCSVSPAQVGAYTATATYLGDGNYSGAFGADSAATVSPATLTVTASSAQFTYGAAVPTITPSYSGFASGESALDLRPAPTCSTTATQSSPVGSYTSSCSGGVDGNYSFSYVAGTVKVARADLTITASDGSFTYGGSPPDIAAEYSGFVNGDDASSLSSQPTCSTTATKSSPVGGYTSTCSGAADANYSITYETGSVTVDQADLTITASDGSFTYGGTPANITAAYSGFVNGDDASKLSSQPTCSTTATKSSPVGSYASSCSGAADANYSIAYKTGSVTVGPAGLIVKASSPSFAYGGDPPAITPTYTGFVNGDNASSLDPQPTCSTVATKSSAVGSYASSCAGGADANYSFSYVDGTVTVSQADLTVTASDGSSTYGQDPPTITASYSGFVNGDSSSSLSTQPTCSTAATKSSPVGSYSSSCTGADDANYSISYTKGSVIVGPADLTVTASDGSSTYGQDPPTITASYSGFANGDSSLSLTTQPTCSTAATKSSPVGSYSSSCTGADDANYSISYTKGSVTVGPAGLTVTASSPSFTYGGTPPTITATYTGFVNGDSAASLDPQPTCSTGATHTSAVGSYASSCSGAADANYSMSYLDGSVSVNPANLTVTASSPSFTYGGTPPTITATYTGFVNNDSSSSLSKQPTCSTTASASSHVGSYPSSCTGAVDANYSMSYAPGSVTVNPAPLTVKASSPSFTYGGSPPTITASYAGFENGDSASSLSPEPSCSSVATKASPVGNYASSCAGAADANYSFSYLNGSVTVDPAPLTITASGGSFTYGGTPPAISVLGYSGFENGDSATNLSPQPSCSTVATELSPVGSYASSCSGAADANYSFSYVDGSVKVTQASLTVTAPTTRVRARWVATPRRVSGRSTRTTRSPMCKVRSLSTRRRLPSPPRAARLPTAEPFRPSLPSTQAS
ncbi:MAG: MBG domain-containing protein [Acidimicrobiales bacterium]